MSDNSDLQNFKGIGPKTSNLFQSIGITTIEQLLLYTPRKYLDFHTVSNIKSIKPGLVTVKVKLQNISSKRVKRSLHITNAQAVDETGAVSVVWFNQPYRAKSLSGGWYYLQGEFGLNNRRLQIVNPSTELVDDIKGPSNIIPIYPERAGIKSRQFERAVASIINKGYKLESCIPESLSKSRGLLDYNQAIKLLHQPKNQKDVIMAKNRLAFEELFVVMLAAAELKKSNKTVKALPVEFKQAVAQTFVKSLPFDLTDDQRLAVWQIYKDIQQSQPMNRLIEGDVGSGKTVVAAMAALMVLESNMQVALLAPTELLARQHLETFKKVFSHTNHTNNLELLVGSMPAKEKSLAYNRINSGEAGCIIGTHAIL
ncbi:MAG: DEAD/DEAH box helicase, partial [Patescibacteria group bacterium]|nr:DEAD/DEAH box helicase [Patescibacteria group bacterium]